MVGGSSQPHVTQRVIHTGGKWQIKKLARQAWLKEVAPVAAREVHCIAGLSASLGLCSKQRSGNWRSFEAPPSCVVHEVAIDECQDVSTLRGATVAGGESRIEEAQQPQVFASANVVVGEADILANLSKWLVSIRVWTVPLLTMPGNKLVLRARCGEV